MRDAGYLYIIRTLPCKQQIPDGTLVFRIGCACGGNEFPALSTKMQCLEGSDILCSLFCGSNFQTMCERVQAEFDATFTHETSLGRLHYSGEYGQAFELLYTLWCECRCGYDWKTDLARGCWFGKPISSIKFDADFYKSNWTREELAESDRYVEKYYARLKYVE